MVINKNIMKSLENIHLGVKDSQFLLKATIPI